MMRPSITRSLWREWRFMLRERAMRLWLWVALAASVIAVLAGSIEVTAQRTTIERLLTADRADRAAQLAQQSDWGSAAYYASHLTYDPPSALAFAALGERDTMPWKHRIRMLALEGQIHEADVANPELALVGRFDLAFVAAFLLPLLVISQAVPVFALAPMLVLWLGYGMASKVAMATLMWNRHVVVAENLKPIF